MTYFFPFGYTNTTAATSSISQTAVTASFTASLSTITAVAYHTDKIFNSGSSGSVGPASTSASCAATYPGQIGPQGPSGSIGPSGSRGPSLTSCPAGSVVCSSLTPPTGYAVVCIEIDGCSGVAVCPDTLP